jgi:hypothetical protein
VNVIDNPALCCYKNTRGAVAQLGERLTGSQEVDSSILFSSTSFANYLGRLRDGPFL